MGKGLARNEFTIADAVKASDPSYMTSHIGKWHLGTEPFVGGLAVDGVVGNARISCRYAPNQCAGVGSWQRALLPHQVPSLVLHSTSHSPYCAFPQGVHTHAKTRPNHVQPPNFRPIYPHHPSPRQVISGTSTIRRSQRGTATPAMLVSMSGIPQRRRRPYPCPTVGASRHRSGPRRTLSRCFRHRPRASSLTQRLVLTASWAVAFT